MEQLLGSWSNFACDGATFKFTEQIRVRWSSFLIRREVRRQASKFLIQRATLHVMEQVKRDKLSILVYRLLIKPMLK